MTASSVLRLTCCMLIAVVGVSCESESDSSSDESDLVGNYRLVDLVYSVNGTMSTFEDGWSGVASVQEKDDEIVVYVTTCLGGDCFDQLLRLSDWEYEYEDGRLTLRSAHDAAFQTYVYQRVGD